MSALQPGPGTPTAPIALAGGGAAARPHLGAPAVTLDRAFVARLERACAGVVLDGDEVGEASRDWWPLAMVWATQGEVAGRAGAVARVESEEEVAAVAALCHEARVPLTAAGGRSGVCGASVPVFGGVVLDLTGLSGIRSVDDTSLVVDVLPGTFGDHFEAELRAYHGVTVGHWPQSMALATVGGWVACRGAGQYSTRYGKIEDLVVGLDVVLADGRRITTGGQPREATGPDLTRLFVGSEGTLGIVTGVRLRACPVPRHEGRAAFAFDSFAAGLDAQRRILRRGATPAVLRLYDDIEADRSYATGAGRHVLLVLDEGDELIVDATMAVVDEECAGAERLDDALVGRWLEHRNDVAALEALISRGYVVDTMEVSGPWAKLPTIYGETVEALRAVPGTLAASAHQSHSYRDGGCVYFTFAGTVEPDEREAYYRRMWDVGQRSVLELGGSLSHHHGIGLNRGRFMAEALGPAFDVLAEVKEALDPHGILNPGKLGLASPFGPVPFT